MIGGPRIRPAWPRLLAALVLAGGPLSGCTVAEPRASGFVEDGASSLGRTDVFALSAQADEAYRAGRWSDASSRYEALSNRVPDDAYLWFRLANTYVRQGDMDRARDAYGRSVERDAASPRAWFNLSLTHLMSARHALLRSRQAMRASDPARASIERRLRVLDGLLRAHAQARDDGVPGDEN